MTQFFWRKIKLRWMCNSSLVARKQRYRRILCYSIWRWLHTAPRINQLRLHADPNWLLTQYSPLNGTLYRVQSLSIGTTEAACTIWSLYHSLRNSYSIFWFPAVHPKRQRASESSFNRILRPTFKICRSHLLTWGLAVQYFMPSKSASLSATNYAVNVHGPRRL
ncbi:hypothetical protein ARMGADRAFT_554154 [Armillaria gallica]|uniref:Uncharacterized protein n=1 Tax=Armillaria gallica TaxID=47427 RepID=A0A2H3CRU0_ARMGA|nr:hypothetical protein ARMGADRAFT_554154 [Armillaria gallica]